MKPNTLDKLIGYVAPAAGLRRIAARAGLQRMAERESVADQRMGRYEGAKTGKRTVGWLSSGASANAEIGVDLARLRERSRELIRNNHFAAKAVQSWKSAVVGAGINARFADPVIQAVWDAWQRRCSADGLAHFAAVQAMVCQTVFESGECLVRFRRRRYADGLRPAFQVQVLEPDYLDLDLTKSVTGGYIIQGVEFNLIGQRVAYWLYGQHPGDVLTTGVRGGMPLTSQRIDAAEVIHVFDPTRPGQVRGVPRLAPVMLVMRDLDDWEDSELVRKKTESTVAMGVTSPEGDSFQFGSEVFDAAGNRVTAMEPGMILKLKPGEDVKFNQPAYAGGYEAYKVSRTQDIAAGVSMPFEVLTGNYSKSNYSSSRMGVVDYGRGVSAHQWNLMIPVLCDGVAGWFSREMERFENVADIALPEWDPPAFDLLDRESEAKADQTMLQIGTMTFAQAAARQGYDPRQQLDEIAEYAQQLKDAGVDFFGGKQSAQPDQKNEPAPASK